ncbi:MAG: cysteine desulfurase [Alphaproteobacteria bacterium]|jgi:cysteine desulfurase|nr:cysteine desulfurase [Alphaproteobacteria bacterium]
MDRDMPERVYLDWNATAPLRPEARAAVIAALDCLGNPSSMHGEGREARRLIEEARERVGALVGTAAGNVTFTSGGTEANMLALSPALETAGTKAPFDRLLVSAIEHPSVRAGGRFAAEAVEEIPVTQGVVDLTALEHRLAVLKREGRRVLVSIMAANNETGVVQPICEAARIVHQAGGLLHVDSVQAAGRIPCDINKLDADLLTVSGHKLGGPQGAGALIRRDQNLHPAVLLKGGGQERGLRAGTENVAAIAGFGAAALAAGWALTADAPRLMGLRQRLEAGLKAASPEAVIFGTEVERVPNTTLFAVPGIKAETAVIALDLDGVAVSSGAACSSGKVQPSHVLAAMGVSPDLARGGVRVSLGWTTTESDIDRLLGAWIKVARALLKERRGIAA